jgi:hypothetical protein
MWKAAIVLVGILLFLLLFIGIPLSTVSTQGSVGGPATPTPATVQAMPPVDVTATMTALNEQKLAADIRKENNDISWGWTTMGTIVIGVVGVLVTFFQAL